MDFSPYQNAVFTWVEDATGHAVVQAVAGAGKTTTLMAAIKHMPATAIVYYLAFNKDIAAETARKAPANVRVKTFHSLGLGVWAGYLRKKYSPAVADKLFARDSGCITEDKCAVLFEAHVKAMAAKQGRPLTWVEGLMEAYASYVRKLVKFAKHRLVLPTSSDTEWYAIIDHFGLELEAENATPEAAIKLARAVLRQSNEVHDIIDYEDMLYLPLITAGCWFPKADFVLVDEAQDTNPARREFVLRMVEASRRAGLRCRTIWVGDRHQAIYGFTGADNDSMDIIKAKLGAVELPLTITYRCPKAVVRFVQQWVSHIEAAETAPEGKVYSLGKYAPKTFKPTDVIICRNTAPLVTMAFALIKRGVGCQIRGRDIAAGLVRLIKQMRAQTLPQLEAKLHAYQAREVAKLQQAKRDTAAAAIQDKVAAVLAVVDSLDEKSRTIPKLMAALEGMFSDEASNGKLLTLSTVHRVKGLEFPRVFMLDRTKLQPARYAVQPWEQAQELNLLYVGGTRSMDELCDISSDCWEEAKKAA